MKPHTLDPFSLVGGILFVSLGVLGASGALVDLAALRLAGPLLLLGLGGVLVASALAGTRRDRTPTDDPAPTEDTPTEGDTSDLDPVG